VKKSIEFQKEHVLLYQYITEIPLSQKPVKNGNKKTLKIQGFRGFDFGASKTVVVGETFNQLYYTERYMRKI